MFGNKIQKMVNKENVFAVVSWCGSVNEGIDAKQYGTNKWMAGWLAVIVVTRFGHKI